MSLLGKCHCKREAAKCHYVKSATLMHNPNRPIYWRGAYGKMCTVLEARFKHNTLHGECFCDTKKQKAGSCLALSYVYIPFVPLVPFRSVPFRVLLIPTCHSLCAVI